MNQATVREESQIAEGNLRRVMIELHHLREMFQNTGDELTDEVHATVDSLNTLAIALHFNIHTLLCESGVRK